MPKYAYEDLSDGQFETLVVALCQNLFGVGVQGFATGPDGGRDAKFVGTAQLFPSTASPWKGVTIIQAKHTNGHNRSFSETDFFSPSSDSTKVAEELPRIKKLRSQEDLDNYILFANRRLTAMAEDEIRSHIAKECALPEESVSLCGLEGLELWLKKFPDVPSMVDLDPVDSPLIVSPDDLSEIVEAFARHRDDVVAVL